MIDTPTAVFISYRRDDSAGQARALLGSLSKTLGRNAVFIDVDSIPLGRDFREVLQEHLALCNSMLVLIGPHWLTAQDSGGRRLDHPDDYVRQEIAAALKRKIPVTPVLMQGAHVPEQSQLPDDLKDLAYRQGFELSHAHWDSDVRELIHRLGLQSTGSQPGTLKEARERRREKAKRRRLTRPSALPGAPPPRNAPMVMSIHGIRTRGEWQKALHEILSGTPTRTASHDYGTYNLLKFLTPYCNNQRIKVFYDWYVAQVKTNSDCIDLDDYRQRPSLAAHSLGSWIVGYAMLKHEDVKLDRLILAGSILPRDFDWGTLFARDQVSSVRNECGAKDPWPGWAARLVFRAGTGGTDGFDWFGAGTGVENVHCDWFGHSDALMKNHMETVWIPYLSQPPSPFGLLHGRDIQDGKRFSNMLDRTGTVVDVGVYSKLPHYGDVEIPRGLSLQWIKVNPDIYTFLIHRDTGLPVGYMNAMPVDDELYANIRAGKVQDNQVNAKHILPYVGPRTLKIYMMSIAIEEKHRRWGDGAFQQSYVRLLASFFDKLIYYAKHHGIRVTHFIATAWTPEGQVMCNWFRGTPVGQDPFGDTIYELELDSLATSHVDKPPAPLRRLLDFYKTMNGR